MLVGNYLDSKEIQELIGNFEHNQKYQNIIREMKHYLPFNEQEFEVVQALKFDVVKNEDVVSAKAIILQYTDNVTLKYIERHINADQKTLTNFFMGEIGQQDEKGLVSFTHFSSGHENYISTFESQLTEEELAEGLSVDEQFTEEFPIDKNYYPGQLLETIEAAGPIVGCIPGGYVYCGESCGGKVACKAGSKAGINGLDNCCKKHDCCYSQYGVKKWPHCYCDQQLCDCSKRAPWKKATAIVQASMCFVC